MDKQRKFLKSALKAKEAFYDDDEFSRYLQEVTQSRDSKKTKAIIKKYGKDLIVKTALWYQDLSESEQRKLGTEMDMERSIHAYMGANPKSITVKDYQKAIGRDGVKPLVRDESLDDIPYPIIDDTGKAKPGRKIKVEKSLRWTSPEEAQKLSSAELASRIKAQADYQGVRGDEIGGLNDILMSKGE